MLKIAILILLSPFILIASFFSLIIIIGLIYFAIFTTATGIKRVIEMFKEQ